MLIALGLYLYDSSVLLFSNEGLLIASGDNRWYARLANRKFLLMGRALHIVNPLLPHRPAFRLAWMLEGALAPEQQTSWSASALALRPLAPLTLLAGIALFAVLPLGLFTGLGIKAVIAALLLLYGSIGAALLRLYRRRSLIDMKGRHFSAFAFECLACPPFGVNMIRRITLTQKILEPLPVAAHRLLDADHWQSTRQQCMALLDDRIALLAEEADRRSALLERRSELMAYGAAA